MFDNVRPVPRRHSTVSCSHTTGVLRFGRATSSNDRLRKTRSPFSLQTSLHPRESSVSHRLAGVFFVSDPLLLGHRSDLLWHHLCQRKTNLSSSRRRLPIQENCACYRGVAEYYRRHVHPCVAFAVPTETADSAFTEGGARYHPLYGVSVSQYSRSERENALIAEFSATAGTWANAILLSVALGRGRDLTPAYSNTVLLIASVVECAVGILCACLATSKPALSLLWNWIRDILRGAKSHRAFTELPRRLDQPETRMEVKKLSVEETIQMRSRPAR